MKHFDAMLKIAGLLIIAALAPSPAQAQQLLPKPANPTNVIIGGSIMKDRTDSTHRRETLGRTEKLRVLVDKVLMANNRWIMGDSQVREIAEAGFNVVSPRQGGENMDEVRKVAMAFAKEANERRLKAREELLKGGPAAPAPEPPADTPSAAGEPKDGTAATSNEETLP